MNEEVCALGLPRSALPRYNDALVPLSLQHGVVRHVRHGVDVRLQLSQCVIIVHFHIFGVVDGQELEGVDDDEDAPDVSVDLLLEKTRAQVVQQRALVEFRQVTQICVVTLRVGLRQQSALHHAPALFCDLQPHLEAATIVDGAVQVLLPQEEPVILACRAVFERHPRPEHHPLHRTVAGVENPFLPAELLDLCENVTSGPVQLQAINHAFDGLRGCGGLASTDGAVDGALGQGTWVDAHSDLRVLKALPPAQGAIATNAIASTHGGAGVPISNSPALARPLLGWKDPRIKTWPLESEKEQSMDQYTWVEPQIQNSECEDWNKN